MLYPEPKGWYSRNYLPHFDRPGLVQAITLRLFDCWEQDLQLLAEPQRKLERAKRMAAYLDAGHGACWLRGVAKIVEDALLHFDGVRYRLFAWVIMPNHMHLLTEMQAGWPLEKLIQSWKTWTAKRANEILKRSGSFWFREFHDRYIRDGDHFANAKRYIEENPVKAHLCGAPGEWRWSSAWKERE